MKSNIQHCGGSGRNPVNMWNAWKFKETTDITHMLTCYLLKTCLLARTAQAPRVDKYTLICQAVWTGAILSACHFLSSDTSLIMILSRFSVITVNNHCLSYAEIGLAIKNLFLPLTVKNCSWCHLQCSFPDMQHCLAIIVCLCK